MIGDICIFTGIGSIIPTTSWAAYNMLNVQDRNDGIYTDAGTGLLEFDEAGLYLVKWHIHYQDTSNGRFNPETRAVQTTGTGDFFSTQGSGYSRNSGNDEASCVGFCFINAAANDQITIQHRRDADAPTGGTKSNGSCNLTAVKIGNDGDIDYSIYSRSTDNAAFGGTTPNDIAWDGTAIEKNTASIERQAGNTDIRLKRDNARYMLIYSIAGDTGGSRTQRVSRAVSGTTLIPGSGAYAYQRQASDEYASLVNHFFHEVDTADEDVSIQCWRGDGISANQGGADVDGSWDNVAAATFLFVMDMPDHWNTAAYYDSTGGQDIAGGFTGDLNAFRNTLWEDTPFSRDNNTDMTVSEAIDVWAFGSTVTARATVSSGLRWTGGVVWEIEGAVQVRGEHVNYSRGNQSSQDTFGCGFCWGFIHAVSANDTFQAKVNDRGDNGGDDTTRANYTAVFFLDLDNLEAAASFDAVAVGRMNLRALLDNDKAVNSVGVGRQLPRYANVANKVIGAAVAGRLAARSTDQASKTGIGTTTGRMNLRALLDYSTTIFINGVAHGRLALRGFLESTKTAAGIGAGRLAPRSTDSASKTISDTATGRIATRSTDAGSKTADSRPLGRLSLRTFVDVTLPKIVNAIARGMIAIRGTDDAAKTSSGAVIGRVSPSARSDAAKTVPGVAVGRLPFRSITEFSRIQIFNAVAQGRIAIRSFLGADPEKTSQIRASLATRHLADAAKTSVGTGTGRVSTRSTDSAEKTMSGVAVGRFGIRADNDGEKTAAGVNYNRMAIRHYVIATPGEPPAFVNECKLNAVFAPEITVNAVFDPTSTLTGRLDPV